MSSHQGMAEGVTSGADWPAGPVGVGGGVWRQQDGVLEAGQPWFPWFHRDLLSPSLDK